MSDDRDLLERAIRRFPAEPGVVERVMRRRDRRRRNQRIASGVLAAIVAVAAIGTLFAAFHADRRTRPAEQRITPTNVRDMQLSWVGKVAGGAATPVVSGSTVYVSGFDGTLYAFPTSCAGPPCSPTWTARIGGFPDTPAVADGVVYVATGGKTSGALSAYSTTCGTGGAVCRPLWTGSISGGIPSNDLGPVVANGVVYIGSGSRFRPHMISAFSTTCASDACSPIWTASFPIAPTSWVVVGDRLFVGTATGDLGSENFSGPRRGVLYAFPTDCSKRCEPVWTWRSFGRIWDLAGEGNDLYVGTDAGFTGDGPGLYRIQADCATKASCSPVWQADTTCCTRVTVSGDLVVAHDEKTAVYAFPTECGDHRGATCAPTWTSIVANPLYFGTPVISDGLVWFGSGADGTVSALPVDCSNYCLPLWTANAGDSVVGVAVSDGRVFAASDGLYVFAPAPPRHAGGSSNGSAGLFYGALLMVGLAWLGVRSVRRSRSRASSM